MCVFLCVCRYGLKVITPEETFTLMASSSMEKAEYFFNAIDNYIQAELKGPELHVKCLGEFAPSPSLSLGLVCATFWLI